MCEDKSSSATAEPGDLIAQGEVNTLEVQAPELVPLAEQMGSLQLRLDDIYAQAQEILLPGDTYELYDIYLSGGKFEGFAERVKQEIKAESWAYLEVANKFLLEIFSINEQIGAGILNLQRLEFDWVKNSSSIYIPGRFRDAQVAYRNLIGHLQNACDLQVDWKNEEYKVKRYEGAEQIQEYWQSVVVEMGESIKAIDEVVHNIGLIWTEQMEVGKLYRVFVMDSVMGVWEDHGNLIGLERSDIGSVAVRIVEEGTVYKERPAMAYGMKDQGHVEAVGEIDGEKVYFYLMFLAKGYEI